MQQRFVYDGQEVYRTGRIATREHSVRGYSGTREVTETVIEITPLVQSGEYAWKRWVKESELFIINDSEADQPTTVVVDETLTELPWSTDPEYDPVDQLLEQMRGKQQNGST